jgi:hypothetical protein
MCVAEVGAWFYFKGGETKTRGDVFNGNNYFYSKMN